MDVAVGDVLTLRGKHFVAGVKKNTVVFKRDGARAVFAKADRSTTTARSWITVPAALRAQMRGPQRGSAVLHPVPPARAAASSSAGATTATLEAPRRRSCHLRGRRPLGSTDRDGRHRATDPLQGRHGRRRRRRTATSTSPPRTSTTTRPGPERVPALSRASAPTRTRSTQDADMDFDGDSLTLAEEHALWLYTWQTSKTDARTLTPLSYSDGEQYSRSRRIESGSHAGRRKPCSGPAAATGSTAAPPTSSRRRSPSGPRAGYRTVMLSHRTPWDWARGSTMTRPHGVRPVRRRPATATSPAVELGRRRRLPVRRRARRGRRRPHATTTRPTAACSPSTGRAATRRRSRSHLLRGQGQTRPTARTSHGRGHRRRRHPRRRRRPGPRRRPERHGAEPQRRLGPQRHGRPRLRRRGRPRRRRTARPLQRVRPGEPVQPVPAPRPVADLPALLQRGTGAPFDGSPNWYALN